MDFLFCNNLAFLTVSITNTVVGFIRIWNTTSCVLTESFFLFDVAVLAAAAPEIAPFMADECLMAIPDIEGIDYTAKEYLKYVQHIRTVVDRLNAENQNSAWSPHRVELALWAHYVTRKLEPSLLDGIPGLEDEPKENGNDTDKTSDIANGSPTGISFCSYYECSIHLCLNR